MSFMQLFIYDKAPAFTATCETCGATLYAHPDTGWSEDDFRSGVAQCNQCVNGHVDPETVRYAGKLYAGRYSAPGYLDCTDWSYGKNKRELARELRAMYGED